MNIQSMIIRKAGMKDITSLKEMMLELAKYEHKISKLKTANSRTSKFISENLPKWLSKKDYFIFIAEDNNKTIGYIFGWKEYVSEAFRNAYVGYICDCYVSEKYRGKGISRKLLEILLKQFRKIGLKEAKLTVLSANPAVNIWNKIGFKEENKEMRLLLR
jgi:ribosomal protein S18 acetylase RimI-like enzyme